jgi:hypothetical protein
LLEAFLLTYTQKLHSICVTDDENKYPIWEKYMSSDDGNDNADDE